MKLKLGTGNILKGVGIIVLIVIIAVYYKMYSSIKDYRNINAELTYKISENYVIMEDIKASNKEALALIKSLKDKNGEQAKFISSITSINKNKGSSISGIGVTKSTIKKTVDRNSNSSAITKTPTATGDIKEDKRRNKLEYAFTKIYAKDSNNNPIPTAWAMYFPNENDLNKKWRTGTYALNFHHTIIESENKDGTFDRAVEVHVVNKVVDEKNAKEYPITVSSIEWERMEIQTKNMSWLNPRFGLGANFTNYLSPKIDLSVASYGRTFVDMDWRFLTVGVGAFKTDKKTEIVLSFEPVSYNFGKLLPLIENVFVGPIITYDSNSKTSYGISMSIPF